MRILRAQTLIEISLSCLLKFLLLKDLSDTIFARLVGRVKQARFYRFVNETLLQEMHSREGVPRAHL